MDSRVKGQVIKGGDGMVLTRINIRMGLISSRAREALPLAL